MSPAESQAVYQTAIAQLRIDREVERDRVRIRQQREQAEVRQYVLVQIKESARRG